MDFENYDIFRKHPDGVFTWIDTVKDFDAAKERLKQLASRSPGEYVAVTQDTLKVVAKQSSYAAKA